MTNATSETLTTEIQRLYGLERALRSALDVLESDVSVDSLDDLSATECRERLRERIRTHREETDTRVERLEAVFDALGEEPTARDVPELEGWVADKEQFNNIVLNDALRPLYYLVAATKLAELERSAYEPALALARRLADEDEDESDTSGIVEPLERTYEEERELLADLESLAESESVESLLEASQVDSHDRSSLDRSRTRARSLNVETIRDLFLYQLWNAYDVEGKLAELLEESATDADRDDVREALADYRERSETHVDRLEDVFDALGPEATASQNHALDGLLKSRRDRLEAVDDEWADLVELGIARAAARFEYRSYDELVALAERADYSDDVVDPLTETLEAERESVETLEGIEFEALARELPAETSD